MQFAFLSAHSRGDLVVCGLIAILTVGSFVATRGEGWESNVAYYGIDPSESKALRIAIRLGAIFFSSQLFIYYLAFASWVK